MAQATRVQPFRILLAEDDPAFLIILADLFEADARFEVVGQAANGRAAVDLAYELEPDVVVMDVEMPVLDGVEATRMIGAHMPGVRVVAVSGHDYEERALEILDAGAADYVRKARVATDLADVVASIAARARE